MKASKNYATSSRPIALLKFFNEYKRRGLNPAPFLLGKMMEFISYSDFEKIDIRVGVVLKAEPFPEARKPAYKLTIDFGSAIGIKKSSAQITHHYTPESLNGLHVAAVVNFAARQIGPFMSEVLTLGFPDEDGHIVLITPQKSVPIGGRLF